MLRDDALACFQRALAAVDPSALVGAAIARAPGGGLVLRDADGRPRAFHTGPACVVGAGKAALAMASALGADARGVVVAPHGAPGTAPDGVEVLRGGHPVPDAAGAAATRRVLDVVRGLGPETLLLVVLSGGASSLLVAPADGVSLADKQAVTRALLAAGADITAMNVVRKHLSAVKGGGLLRAAAGAAGTWTLVLSDVVGDDPATIGSGPTVPDPSTFADAAAVLARWLPRDAVPAAVAERIAAGVAGRVPETPKPDTTRAGHVRLVGSNRTAVDAAAAAAHARGYDVTVLAEPLVGDATAAAAALAQRLATLPRDRRVALVAGGETTVRVAPGGRGGRARHLALAAALALDGGCCALLAAGTDGVDGQSDAAGACVDGTTVARARARGLDPAAALAATDSGPLLEAIDDVVRTGPTGTNVADLVVAVRGVC